MPDKFEPFARQPCLVKPDNNFTLWCPFCDNWRLSDSMVARKKLGLHISSYHPEETRFERGKPPPALHDVKEGNVKGNGKEKVAESHAL
jgi:hypothetical protein